MTRKDAAYRAELEARKRESVGQLLFKCARLFDEQARERVRDQTGTVPLRAAHTALFPHIALEGTRLTDLAARLGVSKQAVGQTVADLETLGVLEYVAHPEDGRAKLVRFSARGRRGLLQGLGVLKTLEEELATDIG